MSVFFRILTRSGSFSSSLSKKYSLESIKMTSTRQTTKILQRSLQGPIRKEIKVNPTKFATKEFEEIQFKVPWGHVAGKWYGPKNTRPLVGFHGWQDNCGTFDTIAPMLPEDVGFLALDLPGHGLSSWLPDGCSYHAVDYVTFIFTVMNEFKWDKISMMCHSLSSANGFVFCSLFPDKCDMLIGLDVLKPTLQPMDVLINIIQDKLGGFHKFDQLNRCKNEPPSYEFDQLVEKVYEGSGKSIDKEVCQFILERNIKPSTQEPNKYYFSRDSRLKSLLFYALPKDLVIEMAERIVCPHLFIKTSQGAYYEKKINYDEVISVLKKKPTFEYHQVEGKHHVHLNEPQKIADIINPFITKHKIQHKL